MTPGSQITKWFPYQNPCKSTRIIQHGLQPANQMIMEYLYTIAMERIPSVSIGSNAEFDCELK